jgi:lipoate-protein ligase A
VQRLSVEPSGRETENRCAPSLLNSPWGILRTAPLDAATNMALDVALMEQAKRTRETVFRVYGWTSPTLSLGRNQYARGYYDPIRLAAEGVEVVRRPTGGRAVLHWREVTYSVTAAADSAAPTQQSYDQINKILLCALRRLGVMATIVARTIGARARSNHPCFSDPSAGEIVAMDGASSAKLIASAQVRENGALLQHGSILIEDDQHLVADLSLGRTARPHAATLRSLLGRVPEFAEIAGALFAAVRDVADTGARQLPPHEVLPIALPHVARFRDPLWTWRL